MNVIRLLALALLAGATASTVQRAPEKLSADALLPIGRTLRHPGASLELIGSAAHFGFSFEGDQCRVVAFLDGGQDHNYLQYELDGTYVGRVRIGREKESGMIIKAARSGHHTVWIYKATEAQTGPVYIRQIEGTKLRALPVPKAPLIEFIGNSITCGAAADPSDLPCGQGVYHDQHNAYLAYGPRLARALGVNYFLSSVSGIGIYRNWNSDGPAMPQVYETARLTAGTAPWNFKTYRPDIVSIALGTNDMSLGDGKTPRAPFDSNAFVLQYVQFVFLVRSKYPQAQIVLLSSPMLNGPARATLEDCLTRVKTLVESAADNRRESIRLFFFQPMQARGCSGHPNVEDHALLARELEPFFRKLLPKR